VDPSQVESLTDFHREFIDPIEVWIDDAKTKKGKRIPEVFDCWVESGSMPFAAIHAPFENKEMFDQAFPAQFITEYIAQTRAWFYVMHVMSVALFDRSGYENVLTTGTVLAADGQKMSKSKKNYPDPSIVLEKYGADAVRYYLMSNPIVNGENMNFNESGVDEVSKKFITIMKNVVSFYGLYKEHDDRREPSNTHVLDQWITARLAETLKIETEAIERYDLSDAARSLQSFVTDLSTWYVRRSRDRVKEAGEDRAEALATLRSTLITFAKMTAPFMPFLAEMIYRDVVDASETNSVHLQEWPQVQSLPPFMGGVGGGLEHESSNILAHMGEARAIVSRVMEVRDSAGRSVKQALGSMQITTPSGEVDPGILAVILDEVNVKTATIVKGAELAVTVDTSLTPALIREGMAREVTRRVNGLRKDSGLTITDRIELRIFSSSDEARQMFTEHGSAIQADTLATLVLWDRLDPSVPGTATQSFRVAEQDITIGFAKIA
jgi:isoleucyl-tRNA synthetase